MYPRYVFLDTNNWIYLANGFNPYSQKHEDVHLKVFDLLEKRANDGSIIVLVNKIVLDEFERNKAQTEAKIHDINSKVKGYIGSLKPLKDFLSDSDKELQAIEKKIIDTASSRIANLRKHNFNVERFLQRWTIQIPISDKQKLRAAEMAVEKKAPFIGDKKNSMADALHILSFAEYVEGHYDPPSKRLKAISPPGFFVTSNSGDFSDPTNKEKLHSDLVPIMAVSGSKFYYVLHKLVNDLEEEFLSKEEQNIIEDAENFMYCEVCNYDFKDHDFSAPFELFDPHLIKGGSRDEDQLGLFKEIIVRLENPNVLTRTVSCDHCGSNYLECPNCNELVLIRDAVPIIECSYCHYKFKYNIDVDEKGRVHDVGFEIVMTYECCNCGIDVEEINDIGFCAACWEYEQLIQED
jgi:hypothetical protein